MMRGRNLDWDDLRVFMAALRAGSMAAAGKALGVNASTIHRRIGRLEQTLGVRLAERGRSGLEATAAGRDLLAGAEAMAAAAESAALRLAGQDLQLEGVVRITAPDDLAASLLLPLLRDFQLRFPGIRVELPLDNRFLSLTRREADVALRPTLTPPPNLAGRRISRLTSGVYGMPRFADGRPLAELPWICWDEGTGPPPITEWQRRHLPAERMKLRSNSMLNQALAADAGIGVAILPCFLGNAYEGLTRIAVDPAWETELWLLTHPDLRQTARVRALLDFLYEGLRQRRGALAGAAP